MCMYINRFCLTFGLFFSLFQFLRIMKTKNTLYKIHKLVMQEYRIKKVTFIIIIEMFYMCIVFLKII